MADKIFRAGGFMIIELSEGGSIQIPIASFSYNFVSTTIHMRNEQTNALVSEQTTLLEDQGGAAIGNEAAVDAYLIARSNAVFPHQAAVAPAITDDNTLGFFIGAQWIDTLLDNAYICLDDATGAAIWKIIT